MFGLVDSNPAVQNSFGAILLDESYREEFSFGTLD
jgi:hypothetical protein